MLFEQQTSRLASLVQTSISVRMCTTMISDISGMCGTIELSEIRRFIRPLEQGSERKTVRDYVNCLKAESYYCERVLKKQCTKIADRQSGPRRSEEWKHEEVWTENERIPYNLVNFRMSLKEHKLWECLDHEFILRTINVEKNSPDKS